MGTYPTQWRPYMQAVKSGDLAMDAGVNRFAARYRMARQLREVSFEGISEKAQAGYTTGLRLSLAYAALDALETAIDSKVGSTLMPSAELSGRLRSSRSAALQQALQTSSASKRLGQRIQTLLSSPDHQDVRPAVERLRHVFVHGEFTPYGSGLATSVWIKRLVDDLAIETLAASDRRFTEWARASNDPPESDESTRVLPI